MDLLISILDGIVIYLGERGWWELTYEKGADVHFGLTHM